MGWRNWNLRGTSVSLTRSRARSTSIPSSWATKAATKTTSACGAARSAARDTPAESVPLHIRNAPTGLMKDLGYGKDYRYAFDDPSHYTAQEYLPDPLRGVRFYEPSGFGHEKRIGDRLEWWRRRGAGPGPAEATGTERIRIELRDALKPAVLKPHAEPGEEGDTPAVDAFTYLLMPMRVS